MAEQKKIPITRISRFFGSQDFQLEQEMGMEWLHGDMHFTLVLFRVDRKKSDVDDVYGESGPEEIRYKAPVEFNGYVNIASPQNKTYASGLVKQMEPGNMTVSVYMKHLEELNIDISYGDYIGYNDDWGSSEFGDCPDCTYCCLLYTSPSPRDGLLSRMPSSA